MTEHIGRLLLGHSGINITMNLYVHVTDDEKKKEVGKIEKMLNVVQLCAWRSNWRS